MNSPDKKDHKPITYFFVKYRVDEKELTVWIQEPETTAQAIEAGKLKGVVTRKKKDCAPNGSEIEPLRITASSENIAAFFAGGGAATCYPDKNKVIYTRVR